MNTARENIYAALFALVVSCAPFETTGRRVKKFDQLSPAQQPALFQQQIDEEVQTVRGKPSKYTLRVDLVVYDYNADPNSTPSTGINALVDAIESVIPAMGSNGQPQTLGGLVSHCFINGKIQTDEGALGDQAVAIIPIEIVTT